MLPLWVAEDKNLFDKHGVDIEVTYVRGVSIEALHCRRSPVRARLATGGSALHDARRRPGDHCQHHQCRSLFLDDQAGDQKDPKISEAKKVGVTNLGDSPDLVLSLLFERWGLQRNKDVTVLGYSRRHAGTIGVSRQGLRRRRHDFRAEQPARDQNGPA